MDKPDLLRLYSKERMYQQSIFGDYKMQPNFNVATFLQFLEKYLDDAKKSYVEKWTRDLPAWLLECAESKGNSTAPVNTYESLIKLFVLTGAALEAYIEMDIRAWRQDGIKPKWKEE